MPDDNLQPIDSSLNKFFGPHERWMYDYGRKYDLPALLLEDSHNLTCVAELKITKKLHDFYFQPVDLGDNNQLIMSQLWKGDLFGKPPIYSKFIPYILQLGGIESSQKGVDAVSKKYREFRNSWSNPEKRPTKDNLPNQNFLREFESLTYFRTNYPLLPGTLVSAPKITKPNSASTRPKKPERLIITAIIDDGIPFAHKNYRNADNMTRIDYCWSQSATPNPDGDTVLFGREFTNNDIDAYISAHGCDEDAIYAEAGLLSEKNHVPMPLDRMHSHGAHVMDSMAGNWDADSEDDVRIIAVDLPAASNWNTSGFGKDMYVLSALHYIFLRADILAKEYGFDGPVPLVLNLSYGISGGPHNGSNIIEAAIDELVSKRLESAPTAVVLPSGNLFSSRLHSVITDRHFEKRKKITHLNWVIQPDDRTSSFLEIWLPESLKKNDQIEIAVGPPNGASTGFYGENTSGSSYSNPLDIKHDGNIVGTISEEVYRGGRTRFLIAIAPTDATPAAKLPSAPSGVWKVSVKKKNAHYSLRRPSDLTGIEAWIHRDESYGQGNTGAKQSYFLDRKNVLYWGDGAPSRKDRVASGVKTRRFGTLNGLATGKHTIVVGGYDDSSKKAARYSSAGALRNTGDPVNRVVPNDAQVDISAMTERGQWSPGIVGAGTRSGITVALRGTSSAAPQISRALGELFYNTSVSQLMKLNIDQYISRLPAIFLDQVPIAAETGEIADPDKTERLGLYKLKYSKV